MEYSVRVWSAVQGDVVPLRYVAEAMARCAATGYGTLPLHGPTLKNLRPERALLLLDAVRNGHLTVCDSQGRIANASELVDTAKELAHELSEAVPAEAMNAEAIVSFLHARRQHLIEWGKANGDIFLFVETPGTLVESDLRDFLCDANDPGYGRVIEPGHNRGHIGGGECEPWHDNLPGTAPAPTAAPAPVVAASEGLAIPKSQRPDLLTPLIEKAQRNETEPFNAAVIWPTLCEMAETKTKPLIGKTEDGIQWTDGNDDVQYLTLVNLRDRLARQAKKAR